jgi:hypothetical protein
MIKYYRKKGTDKTTHKTEFHSGITFLIDAYNNCIKSGSLEILEWLKENGFEEVMDDSNPTFTGKVEGKLHFGEKVDRALEEVKNLISEFGGLQYIAPFLEHEGTAKAFKIIEKFYNASQNLVNAIEDLRADATSEQKGNSVATDINVATKNDVKLPEVGKRYRARLDYKWSDTSMILKGRDYQLDKIETENRIFLFDARYGCFTLREFRIYFEELPEDNIEELDGMVKIVPDICDEYVKPTPSKALLEEISKSIWKDVSELPKKDCQVMVKTKEGEIKIVGYKSYDKAFYDIDYLYYAGSECQSSRTELRGKSLYNVEYFCTLTDYINDQEQFKQYVLGRLNKEGK